jgi:hypothetical protein
MMKKNLVFTLALGALHGLAFAQTDLSKKYAETITGDDLRKHLTIISADDMEGRETGTEGQRKAASYIELQFKTIGLKAPAALKGYQQLYPLVADSMEAAHAKLNGSELVYGSDYYVQVSKNDNCAIQANELVFAGYGISEPGYDDYAGKDVKGKIVVVFLGEPKENGLYLLSNSRNISEYTYPGLSAKAAKAKEKGAVGIIVIQQTMKNINNSVVNNNAKTNLTFQRKDALVGLPSIVLSSESATKLFTQWKMDSLVAQAKQTQRIYPETVANFKADYSFTYQKKQRVINASNVLGYVEGTDKKDEYVFVTGHYDHLGKRGDKIFHGADDDGSGTCGVIEMAEAFAKAKAAGHGPRRTVVFMTVSGEEKGLWGSEYYSDYPVFSLDKTSVDLNIDMVGRKDPGRKEGDNNNYVYVIGHDKLSSDLPVINEGVNARYTQLEFDYKYDDPNDKERIYYRSDHYNFAKKGVPILFFFDGIHEDYHKTTDTVDKINFDLYEKRIRMIFHTAWEIANRDQMLKRDIPLPAEN